jgi:hypothetical protein
MHVKVAAEGSTFVACQTGTNAKTLTGIEYDKRQQISKAYNNDTEVGEVEFNLIILSQSWCNINSSQSNFSAVCILPSSYLFWAGKRLVGYL